MRLGAPVAGVYRGLVEHEVQDASATAPEGTISQDGSGPSRKSRTMRGGWHERAGQSRTSFSIIDRRDIDEAAGDQNCAPRSHTDGEVALGRASMGDTVARAGGSVTELILR